MVNFDKGTGTGILPDEPASAPRRQSARRRTVATSAR